MISAFLQNAYIMSRNYVVFVGTKKKVEKKLCSRNSVRFSEGFLYCEICICASLQNFFFDNFSHLAQAVKIVLRLVGKYFLSVFLCRLCFLRKQQKALFISVWISSEEGRYQFVYDFSQWKTLACKNVKVQIVFDWS